MSTKMARWNWVRNCRNGLLLIKVQDVTQNCEKFYLLNLFSIKGMNIRLLAFSFFLCCVGSIATSQSCDKVCHFNQWVTTTVTDFVADFKFRWENGNDINARGKKQETRLHLAVLDGRPSKIQALIKAGADVMARNYWGNTPLDWAIERGDTAIIQILLDAEAEVMATEKDGEKIYSQP